MAKMLFDTEPIKATADKIRERAYTENEYSTEEMPAGVEAVYQSGFTDGENSVPSIFGSEIVRVEPAKGFGIGPCVKMSYIPSEPIALKPKYGSNLELCAPFSDFGDAQTNDVAEGVTFTAAGGFNAVGTRKVSEPILYGTYLLRDNPRITTPSDTLILDLNDSESYGFYLDGGDVHYGAISSVEFCDDGFIYVNIEDTYIEYDGTRWAYYDPLASEFVNPPDERYKIIDQKVPISVSKDIYDMFMGCVDNDQGNTSFDIGRKAQYDEFWDAVQNFGKRTAYNYGFIFWGDNAFYPKYDIKPVGWSDAIFNNSGIVNLKQRLLDCGVVLDTSKATGLQNLFSGCTNITNIPIISAISTSNCNGMFHSNNKLVEIEKLILKSDGSQTFSNTFGYCYLLENLTIEGTIGQNGLNLQWSDKLSRASIESIINALSTTTSGLSITLSKPAVNKAFETSAGKNDGYDSDDFRELVQDHINWTINLA